MKDYLIVFALLIFGNVAIAKKISGILVKDGDTARVTFTIPLNTINREIDFVDLQKKIKYDVSGMDTSAEDGKMILYPDTNTRVIFVYNNDTICLLAATHPVFPKKYIFMPLIVEGQCRLFHFYTQSMMGMVGAPGSAGGVSITSSRYYIIREGENDYHKVLENTEFAEDMIGYFSDCVVLTAKIRDEKLRANDIPDIVKGYNSLCGR